jgi:hypothetical protein
MPVGLCHPVMIVMRLPLILIALTILSVLLIVPTVKGAPPTALKVISGSLNPGETASFPWILTQNVTEYLFNYKVTGGSESLDVIYVLIQESQNTWSYLMGEGWAYCDCALSAATYTVTIQADAAATGRLSYSIGFYLVPQSPVDFSGFIPANSNSRVSSFGVLFPSSGNHTVVPGTTAGSFEFFVDGKSQGVISGPTTLTLDLTSDFHYFEVVSLTASSDKDVKWTVQFQEGPRLEVSIPHPCPKLNPNTGQDKCVLGASATASDGGHPTVTYEWTASGGQFNSTSSQWVEWTAPQGVATYTLTVRASAPGYTSGDYSQVVQVVPEFQSFMNPLLLILTIALVTLARRKPAMGPRASQSI